MNAREGARSGRRRLAAVLAVSLGFAVPLRAQTEAQLENVKALQVSVDAGGADEGKLRQFLQSFFVLAQMEHPLVGELVDSAVRAAESLDDHDLQAEVQIELGYVLNRRGELDRGLVAFETAAELAVDHPELRLLARVVLVDPLMQVGRFEEARAAADEARELFDSMEVRPPEMECKILHAELRLDLTLGLLDRVPPALERLEVLVGELHARQPPDRTWDVVLTGDRLDWAIKTRRFDKARDVEAGLDPEVMETQPQNAALVHLRLGVCHWELGDDAAATRRFEEVLDNPGAADADRLQALTRLAEIELRNGWRDAARAHLRSARSLLSAGRSSPGDAGSLQDVLFLTGLEHRAGLTGLAQLDEAFVDFVKAWRSVGIRPGGIGVVESPRYRLFLLQRMRARMEAQPGGEGRLAALSDLMEVHGLGSLARSIGGELAAPTLAELRGSLGDSEGMLVYFLGRDDGVLFAFDRMETRCIALPGELALVDGVHELTACLRRPTRTGADLAASAADLARALLPAEIEPLLARWSSVTVAGLGHLGAIPFELLPCGAGRLEERLAVAYQPSMIVAGLLARRVDPRVRVWRDDLCLVAAPVVAVPGSGELGKLRPLAFDRERQAGLVGRLDAGRVVASVGREARVEALARDGGAFARVLTVLAHGYRDETRERSASFVLVDREGKAVVVGCDAIEALRVPPIVILAACEASQGHARAGDDGVTDLSGALLRAGAQVVFLAPFRIDYEDACVLVGFLLERLRMGDTPAVALRRARARFLAESRVEDPSRGLLQVVGLGNRPVF